MEKIKSIINIRHKTYTPEDEQLLQLAANSSKFRYRFIPLIAYNKKTSGENDLTQPTLGSFNDMVPFALYELGIPIAILRSYMGSEIKKEDLISTKKAFKELKNFASHCYERIIADLCCQILIKEVRQQRDNEHIIFFIEKSASDKMLGRLASLYLDLDKVTICFLVFDPSALMTTVMSYQAGKLHFDINRLMTEDTSDFFGPYPGDSEDSLIQTYFYKPPRLPEGGGYRPMRVDIFTQGLRRDEIDRKKELIKDILCPGSPDTEFEREKREPRLLMPMGFKELRDKLEYHKKDTMQRLLRIEE